MAENEKEKKAAEDKKAADAKKAAEDKKAAEEKKAAKEKKLAEGKALSPAKARAKLLKARLKSTTTYPREVVRGMRMELKAIEDGTWKPVYKPPHIKTAYERHMDS